jgi:hypothetical protein
VAPRARHDEHHCVTADRADWMRSIGHSHPAVAQVAALTALAAFSSDATSGLGLNSVDRIGAITEETWSRLGFHGQCVLRALQASLTGSVLVAADSLDAPVYVLTHRYELRRLSRSVCR